MSADIVEQAQTHLLTHALAMGGWLAADYIESIADSLPGTEAVLVTDPPLFRFVDDPGSVPHQRYHLTGFGVTVAAKLSGIDV